MVENKENILVLGAGISGVAAARLAKSLGNVVTLLDTGKPSDASLELLRGDGIDVITGQDALSWKGNCDLAIYSPGIPLGSPLDLLAIATGARRVSELAYGASFMECTILAVTGTNGKTTTVEMLEHCLKGAGYDAIAAGNIGLPISELVRQGRKPEVIVAEVSSFQLEHPEGFAPDAAVILNITPDHLVRHFTMENYIQTKLDIFGNIKTKCVINSELLQIKQVSDALHNLPYLAFSSESGSNAEFGIDDGWLICKGENGESQRLIATGELPFSGRHNMENALAALAVGAAAGISPQRLAPQLADFHTGAHRLECVLERYGISFVDDSKATNVDALVKALDVLAERRQPIALIAGGIDKKCTLDECLPKLKECVQSVYLIGECRDRLMTSWGSVVDAHVCDTMEEAVFKAADSLLSGGNSGGIVLLSPACASQDMFRDYAERGRVFSEAALRYREPSF